MEDTVNPFTSLLTTMKNFFGSQIIYFLLWAGVTYAAQRFLPSGLFLIPLIGGLGLWFYLNRDKPTPKGPTGPALLLLFLLAASCSRDVAGDAVAERIAPDTVRAAYVAMPDTIVWATRTEQEGKWDATRPVKW